MRIIHILYYEYSVRFKDEIEYSSMHTCLYLESSFAVEIYVRCYVGQNSQIQTWE